MIWDKITREILVLRPPMIRTKTEYHLLGGSTNIGILGSTPHICFTFLIIFFIRYLYF